MNPEDDHLSEEDRRELEAADRKISSALFDAEMGSTSWVSPDMPPELQQIFQDRVRAFHAEGGAGRVAIGALFEPGDYPKPEELPNEEAALEPIFELLNGLAQKGVIFEPPHRIPPLKLYRFLLTDFAAHEIAPPDPRLPIFVPFEEVETTMDFSRENAAEAFLMVLLGPGDDIPEELFSNRVRLGDQSVSRDLALDHLRKWKARFTAIRPGGFAPGPHKEDEGFIYQFISLSYTVTYPDGKTEEFEGPGVVQLTKGEPLTVSGATVPGFEF